MAGTYSIICEQKATFSRVITWRDSSGALVNLTGYTATMDVIKGDGTLIVALTTGNGRITLGGAAGTITLTISATDTTALTPGTYVYDLVLSAGSGVVTRLLQGNFVVEAGVS